MSEILNIVTSTADRLFADLIDGPIWQMCEDGDWPADAWQQLVDTGLPQATLAESAGGTGLAIDEALPLLELTGYYALPLPLAESTIANHCLRRAGLTGSDEPCTLASPLSRNALVLERAEDRWYVSGQLRRIPFGRHAHWVVAEVQTNDGARLLRIPARDFEWQIDSNLAGEPRDTVCLERLALADEHVANLNDDGPSLLALAAAARSLQMAGAMRRILEMSVQYANERVQFGRPIGKFQAVQQQLAAMAGEVAAAGAAADNAVEQIGRREAVFAIAVAKARVGEAAGTVAAIGHQVHAAIGFTREHTLQYRTRRLWSWRDEFGNEAYWQRQLGALAADHGGDGLWPFLTAATGAHS